LTGRSRADQLGGVEQLIALLPHSDRGKDARTALDEFIGGSLTKPGFTSTVAVTRALGALDALNRPMPDIASAGARRPALAHVRAAVSVVRQGVGREPRVFLIAVAGSVAYAALTIGLAFVLARVARAEWYPPAVGGRAGTWSVLAAGSVVAGIFLGRALALFAQRIGARVIQIRLRTMYRAMVADRYANLPMRWHRQYGSDERIAVAHSDTETAWRPVAALPVAVGGTIIATFTLLSLALIDLRIAVVGVVLLVALVGASLAHMLVLDGPVARAKALRAEVFALSTGAGDGGERKRRFDCASAQLRTAVIRVRTVRALFDPVVAALPALAGLVVIGILAVNGPPVTNGRLLAALCLFTVIASPVKGVGWLLTELAGGAAAAERLRYVMAAGDGLKYGSAPAAREPSTLCFDAVTVHRPEGSDPQPLLRNVNLELRPGRIIAVVGAPGSGRSAFAMLAARRLDPDLGAVRFGGTDLRSLSRDALDGDIAFVPPSPHTLVGTVRSAIELGREGVSDDDVWRALQVVREDEFIARLKDGIDSPVHADGCRFSGRQRHRLAMASAVVGRPRLVVLDSISDGAEFDASVLSRMRRLHGSTIVVVTNQVDAIVLADDVVYLDGSGGTTNAAHSVLMRSDPAYAQLFAWNRETPVSKVIGRDSSRVRAESVLYRPPNRIDGRDGPIEYWAAVTGMLRRSLRRRRAEPASTSTASSERKART
jgi:ATP-binding cassette subfamily B protein